MTAGIGHRVRQLSTGRIGCVTTFYDNGDLMVRVDDNYERWPTNDSEGLGRFR